MTTPTLTPWPGFDPDLAPRIAPACNLIAALLADGRWHSWNGIVLDVSEDCDLDRKTVANLLYSMVRHGALERRGTYQHGRYARCTRRIRLTTNPTQKNPK